MKRSNLFLTLIALAGLAVLPACASMEGGMGRGCDPEKRMGRCCARMMEEGKPCCCKKMMEEGMAGKGCDPMKMRKRHHRVMGKSAAPAAAPSPAPAATK